MFDRLHALSLHFPANSCSQQTHKKQHDLQELVSVNHHRKAVLWCKCLKSGHVEQAFKTAKWFHGIFIHDQNILDICQKVLRHSSATFRRRFIFPKTTFICPTKKLTRNLSFLFEKAETLSGMFGKKGKILLEKSEKPTNQTSNYTSGIYKTSPFPKCRGKWT